MVARTVRLDSDLDPLALGARTGLLWHRAGGSDPVCALAGLGRVHRFLVDRPDGAGAAQAALAELASGGEGNEVGGPGTGPVAFGAFPFDPTLPGHLMVPEIVVGRGTDGRRWLTVFDDDMTAGTAAVRDAVERVTGAVASSPVSTGAEPDPISFELTSVLPPEVWRDEIVALTRDRIKAGELQKAVLARELRLRTDRPISLAPIVDHLASTFPAAILFAVDGFVGASPELLVSRHGDIVRAHPLAGTAPRAADPADDRRLAAGLLASSKDRWEHQVTIDWLLDGLLPFCSYVDAEPEPSIVSLANVHHLGTLVEGRLSAPPASALELVAALHPTPAVGGAPQDAALALITEMERTDRGRYAGPVGWVDADGNGAFAVGIRSAQLDGTEARLFAGVGVVDESDPEAELAETRAKFRAMLGALIRP